MSDNNGDHILELSPNCITFEPVSNNVSVFYDETNRQIFAVLNNGTNGVYVKGPDENSCTYFILESRGDILSIKFSPACDVLALQRSVNTVEFINFTNGHPSAFYSQCAKTKNCKVLGFLWTNSYEIVFITDTSIELYQIHSDRKTIKCLKTFNISIDWYIYQPNSSILLLTNGTYGNVLQAFQFRPNTMYKLSRFEIEWTKIGNNSKLLERDVAMANIYGKTCLLVLKHQQLIKEYNGAHIVVYTFQKDGPPIKTDILLLNLNGRFAINIVDDLIIVHHQTSQSSLIYDIRFPSIEMFGSVHLHNPILPPNSIKPFEKSECELYSSNWIIFQPNIIIDARMGNLWLLQINLHPIIEMIKSKPQLIDFLMVRRNSKSVMMSVCRNAIFSIDDNQFGSISLIFNKLNQSYRESICDLNQTVPETNKMKLRSVVDQNDMFTDVLSILDENKMNLDDNFIVAILFEYIYSLSQYQIPIQYYIYEFLISHLIRTKRFYQLQQFFQYHVFTDSKQLASKLLSLGPHYLHAIQLGLDMLKRLSTADEDIVDVLLSQYQVSRALKYVQLNNNIDTISARKFLEIAMNSGDTKLFYSTFKFFELRNLRLRGCAAFAKGENCEKFIDHFEKHFGTSSSLNETSK